MKEGVLHLGRDTSINTQNIIGIMDLESTSISKISREFLKTAEDEDRVLNVSEEEIPKSYVIYDTGFNYVVYITNISSKTLEKRTDTRWLMKNLT